MEVVLLSQDGRCRWLENKVLSTLLPDLITMAANPFAKKRFLIVDWISNDKGRVGVDLKWFKSLGVPAVKSYSDIPIDENVIVVNTGYDSIVNEEKELTNQGVELVDLPCPFVRRLRVIFEEADDSFQYIFVCEDNHITVKNFSSIFPKSMILVQMENYQKRISEQQDGRPFKIVTYVTYLQKHADSVSDFLTNKYPERESEKLKTSCLWIHSKASPIIEIDNLTTHDLNGVKDALLITTMNSTNKSNASLEEALEEKGLNVINIGNLRQFIRYESKHRKDKVLLVKSPIPNNAETPILAYIEGGISAAIKAKIKQTTVYKKITVQGAIKLLYLKNMVFRKQAKEAAKKAGLLKVDN